MSLPHHDEAPCQEYYLLRSLPLQSTAPLSLSIKIISDGAFVLTHGVVPETLSTEIAEDNLPTYTFPICLCRRFNFLIVLFRAGV